MTARDLGRLLAGDAAPSEVVVSSGLVTTATGGNPPYVTIGGRLMRFIDNGGSPQVGDSMYVISDGRQAVAWGVGSGCPTFTGLDVTGRTIDHASLAYTVSADQSALLYVRRNGAVSEEVRREAWGSSSTLVDTFALSGAWAIVADPTAGTIYTLRESGGTITLRNSTSGSDIGTLPSIGNMTGFNNRNSAAFDPSTGTIFLVTTLGLYRVTLAAGATQLANYTGNIFGQIGPVTADGGVWWRNNGNSTTRHWSPTYGVRDPARNIQGFVYCNSAGDLYYLWNEATMNKATNSQESSVTFPNVVTDCPGPSDPDWSLGWWKMSAIAAADYSYYTHLFFWSDSSGEFYAWNVG